MRLRNRALPPIAMLALFAASGLAAQDEAAPDGCRGGAYLDYEHILGSWRNTERDRNERGELEVVGTGESHIREVVGGCGIVEHRTSYREGEEHARLMFLRAYDHERGRWNQVLVTDFPAYIVWAVQPLEGRRTRFTTSRIIEGDTVHVRMLEEPIDATAFRRTFESSRDGGRSWSLNVIIDYTRMGQDGPIARESGDDEEAAVRSAVQHYLRGHATGDGSHHARVFHPESRLFWVRDGEIATRTSAEYIAGAPGAPAEDEARRARRIARVDVTGTAAVAKIELDYPAAFITDYFTLLKIGDEWRIMNKIFHVAPGRR